MEESLKYFVPEISDIRVGYECEIWWNYNYLPKDEWCSVKVLQESTKDFDLYDFTSRINKNEIRVPYLTKEQIEDEGWVRQNNYLDETKNQRFGGIPDYELKTEFGSLRLFIKDLEKPYENISIERYTKSDHSNPLSLSGKWFVYRGICKDINTFRYICKLLNIK